MSLNTPPPSSQLLKTQRILACILCQQRKVKCDRKFPCANCVKARAQCVPATLAQPRRRRRRFPERELLERLRKYEELLRRNKVAFEPLHKDVPAREEPYNAETGYDSDEVHSENVRPDSSTLSADVASKRGLETKSIWHAMSQGFRDSDNDSNSSLDDVRETAIKKAWDDSVENEDNLLFGARRTNADLSALHPDTVQIFRHWQIYLDNVNPLLKVTHTPTLQGRIVEAVSNITEVIPTLEALMFSIYCTSIVSLTEEDCQAMFGSSRKDLSTRYQFGCQQALLNCAFLRSGDRDCLTALFLYLVSAGPSTVPQSLSSLLGVAIRIAQRMGIHNESALEKCTPFEAEMRRRLWWSLMLFDTRIGEIANSKPVILDPTWDCRIPLHVNDSDLRLEMKEPPTTQERPTEAIFAVVRSELGEAIRHTAFHLDFTNPALKPLAKHFQKGPAPEAGELVRLGETIEDRYLKYCDEENPLHFMTICTTRAYLVRCRLLEHHSRCSESSVRQTNAQRDAVTSYAIKMLECDTGIMASPLTKGYLWLNKFHFPFPAYLQIVQDLRRRPSSEQAHRAWEVLSDNYEAWFDARIKDDNGFVQLLAKLVLQAWEACEAACKQRVEEPTPPRIVSHIRHTLAQSARHSRNAHVDQLGSTLDMGIDEHSMPMPVPVGFADQDLSYSMEMLDDYAGMSQNFYSDIPGLALSDPHATQLGWNMWGG